MSFRHIACLSLLMVAASAQAQTYRCSSGGSTYLSDRPCAAPPKATLGAYGPSRSITAQPYASLLPGAPKAQDHVKYLSADCASVSEAIRTGPTRGVRGDQSLEQQTKRSQRDGLAREREQAKLQSDQCGAMRDVIALKRKRESALNAKEVEALRDLERGFNERCIAR